MKPSLRAACAAALLGLGVANAHAGFASFTGALGGPSDVKLFQFTLNAASDVSVRTFGYAGGTNAAGATILAGGFDPIVSLFAGSGPSALLIDANDDGIGVDVDLLSGFAHDAFLDSVHLAAGVYTVALSNFALFANGPTLGDGFFTGAGSSFDGRSSAWALDVLGVDQANSVPEPMGLALVLPALGLLAARSRKRA